MTESAFRPRLVALDLDGTVIRSDRTVSRRTITAITGVQRAGVPVILATGRPPRALDTILATLGHRYWVICANGALTMDPDQRVIEENMIPADITHHVVTLLRDELPGLTFALEHPDHLLVEAGYHLGRTDSRSPAVRSIESATPIRQPCLKLFVQHPTLDEDELARWATRAVGTIVTPTRTDVRGSIEITGRRVTKGSALARLCDVMNVDAADVAAFGDMPNDLSMLKWAALSVAVANAHPDVLKVATTRTASNDADGVAMVLERLIRERAEPTPVR